MSRTDLQDEYISPEVQLPSGLTIDDLMSQNTVPRWRWAPSNVETKFLRKMPGSERRVSRRYIVTGLGTFVVVSSMAGCAGSSNGDSDGGEGGADVRDPPSETIEMTNELTFNPGKVSINVGEKVKWTNVGAVEHSVTAYEDRIPSDAKYFASGDIDDEEAARRAFPDKGGIRGGDSYEVAFEKAGAYEYFCIPHESTGMTGSIEVS